MGHGAGHACCAHDHDDPQGPPHVHHMPATTAYHAAKFGMWLFLATEVLLFGGLFAAFAVYHWMYYHEFHEASTHLNWKMGAINTLVLLFSSLTAAMAVTAAQRGENKKVQKLLLITVGCGVIFLIVKFFEYKSKYEHGLFPGLSYEGAQFGTPEFAQHFRAYFGLYYCMTGLHALHVIIGMGLIFFWPYMLARKNRFSSRYYTPVEMGALYWHLVDLIWIYLFPLLYLIG
jgi:cytochrome c oxidase subunit 3